MRLHFVCGPPLKDVRRCILCCMGMCRPNGNTLRVKAAGNVYCSAIWAGEDESGGFSLDAGSA